MSQSVYQKTANKYLQKFSLPYSEIDESNCTAPGIIVVIPSYKETNLEQTIRSISNCKEIECNVLVIVMFNGSEEDTSESLSINEESLAGYLQYIPDYQKPKIKFTYLKNFELPKKIAGVGTARKIGMDVAVKFFERANHNGIISCLDADSIVEPNYLEAILQHFTDNPETTACSIHYEHPISGEDYPKEVYDTIIDYELYLRYYNLGLKYANLPFAFHTIGSCMAVKCLSYCEQGGMNKRKAGEDFYFLQKFIKHGKFSEINSTKIIPSPRMSDRVPFGTGRAVKDHLESRKEISAYSFGAFENLKTTSAIIPDLYTSAEYKALPEPVFDFLQSTNSFGNINRIRKNSKNKAQFVKHIYFWFDAFLCLKFMHYYRDSFQSNIGIVEAVNILLEKMGLEVSFNSGKKQLLFLRKMERKL